MRVAVLLSFVALAASSCDGAEPGGKVPSDQQVAFESYRRAWAAERGLEPRREINETIPKLNPDGTGHLCGRDKLMFRFCFC